MQNLSEAGYKWLVVARERSGRFMAPRQSRKATPEAAIRDTVNNIVSDRESWDNVQDFLVFAIGELTLVYTKKVETETPEPITTVTYERK